MLRKLIAAAGNSAKHGFDPRISPGQPSLIMQG
jgi:hypothetical protein